MVWHVTHYYYDGSDLDFVNDDLDANRVKIVGTRDATIAETMAELMNLFCVMLRMFGETCVGVCFVDYYYEYVIGCVSVLFFFFFF